MKKFLQYFVVILMIGLVNLSAQNVNVRMKFNGATNLDTLKPNHVVQIRGEVLSGTVSPSLTWDSNTGITMTNVGGDVWEANFQMAAGSQIKYKFWTGYTKSTGTFFWDGWEGPLSSPEGSDDNRYFTGGNTDTTALVQFYNGDPNSKPQYWRPFELKEDSIAVYFRVNMAGIIQEDVFDPENNGPVVVRGNAPLDWDVSFVTLAKETGSQLGETFYSGYGYVAKTDIQDGQTQNFKFVIEDLSRWEEGITDRSFNYTFEMFENGFATIHWYYFQDLAPRSGDKTTANLSFRLKLDALENVGLFDRGLGDRIMVLGPNGWDPLTDGIEMTFVPALQEWIGQETMSRYAGSEIIYKYYIKWDTTKVDPDHANFVPGLTLDDGWEEPSFTGGADRIYLFTEAAEQTPQGDFGREQQFFNSLPPEAVITTPIDISFHINMKNATLIDSNAANPLFRPGLDSVWVQFDGSLMPITQGFTMWGTDNRILLDDIDGDGIYSGKMSLTPPTLYQASYRVVYKSTDGEVWNGGGVQRGRRYYQFIHPESISDSKEITWPSKFDFPVMPWKASELIVEEIPNLQEPTSVLINDLTPSKFDVTDNYPNPFNPSTKVRYSIPEKMNIEIRIYDAMGSSVQSLVNEEMESGNYEVTWNGTNAENVSVSSGLYFMRIQSAQYSKTVKMILMK
ncbi:MAG: T9SS type A sorting domain-containing protein [Melioribacteraceae bacterium]|nr:T9SS type A sorting domain-containing protein [Melioribacteraceae bacterium]